MVAATETNMPPKAVPRSYRDGENFELYVNHFNRIAAANEWEEGAKMAYLETKLTGKAQRQFEVFIEEEPEITYGEITEKLIEELEPSPQRALDEFTGMRLEDKSPKELYGALVRQSKLAHGEMNENARHIIVRTQMLQVLPKKLRTDAAHQGYLADMNKVDFLELVTRVYDAEMRDDREATYYEPTVSQVQRDDVESRVRKLEEKEEQRGKAMDEMMGMLKDISLGLQRSRGGSCFSAGKQVSRVGSSDKVTCYRCLKEGHYARDCPNGVTCTKCREEGHVRAKCPKN